MADTKKTTKTTRRGTSKKTTKSPAVAPVVESAPAAPSTTANGSQDTSRCRCRRRG